MPGDNADPKIRKHLGIIEQELTNANEIITNLLDFSRVRQPDAVKITLDELLRNSLERYDFGSIEVDRNIKDIEVIADPGQVRQVILNLVTNALQAMSQDGGKLSIETGLSGAQAWIAIKDSGSGIEPAILMSAQPAEDYGPLVFGALQKPFKMNEVVSLLEKVRARKVQDKLGKRLFEL